MAQEATRLASLGLGSKAIAERLDVDRSTITRWMAAGKLSVTKGSAGRKPNPEVSIPPVEQPAREWSAAVREAYALDATDEQLVTVAEAALAIARDGRYSPQVQLSAMGRFAAIVKQLALVARNEPEAELPKREEPKVSQPARVRTFDPRTQLMAVK